MNCEKNHSKCYCAHETCVKAKTTFAIHSRHIKTRWVHYTRRVAPKDGGRERWDDGDVRRAGYHRDAGPCFLQCRAART